MVRDPYGERDRDMTDELPQHPARRWLWIIDFLIIGAFCVAGTMLMAVVLGAFGFLVWWLYGILV